MGHLYVQNQNHDAVNKQLSKYEIETKEFKFRHVGKQI